MTTVLPPPPPPPPSGGSQPANTATLVTPSAEIANLARGTTIEGVVLAAPAKNQIQVQTVMGTVVLQTATKVPVNSVITLTLSQLQPQPVLQVTSINGVLLVGSAAQSANPVADFVSSGAAQVTPPKLSVGNTVSATLLRPATGIVQPTYTSPAPASPASGQASFVTANDGGRAGRAAPSPGPTTPSASVAGLNPGAAKGAAPTVQGTTQQGTAQQGTSATPNVPTSYSANQQTIAGQATSAITGAQQTTIGTKPVPASTSPGITLNPPASGQGIGGKAENTVIPSGTKFPANIIRIDPPTGGTVTNTTPGGGAVLMLARGSVLTGTITGTTASGQPIIQFPSATVAIDTAGGGVVGSRVTIEIMGDAKIPKQGIAADAMLRAGAGEQFIKSNRWDSLSEALKVIEISDPHRFQQIMQNAMPQTGNKLSAQILFFLSALRGGDLKSWLGDSTQRLLERERPGLLSRLNNEFQAMAKLADEPSSGDWRMALIPIYHDEKVERIRLYQRRTKDKKEPKEDGKRFVLDFYLSQLGHMQVDGLVKPDGSRVDLIIRTEKPLGQNAQMEIAQIYNEAAELTGIGGGVAFQASPGNFVEFPSMSVENNHDGLIV